MEGRPFPVLGGTPVIHFFLLSRPPFAIPPMAVANCCRQGLSRRIFQGLSDTLSYCRIFISHNSVVFSRDYQVWREIFSNGPACPTSETSRRDSRPPLKWGRVLWGLFGNNPFRLPPRRCRAATRWVRRSPLNYRKLEGTVPLCTRAFP